MFMVLSSWQSHCESSHGSFDECRTAPSGRRPKTKPDDLGCESACTGCQSLHPPLPVICALLISYDDDDYNINPYFWPSPTHDVRDFLKTGTNPYSRHYPTRGQSVEGIPPGCSLITTTVQNIRDKTHLMTTKSSKIQSPIQSTYL